MIDGMPELLTMPEAARLLGIAPGAATAAAARGYLRAQRVGVGRRAVWITTADEVARYAATRQKRRTHAEKMARLVAGIRSDYEQELDGITAVADRI